MKTQSNVLYILRLTLTLLLITSVVAAALAGINTITEPIIKQLNEERTQKAISAVLPGGGTLLESFPDETGIVEAVYASDTGYAIQVTPAGFSGEVVMMVGVIDGKVSGISIISRMGHTSMHLPQRIHWEVSTAKRLCLPRMVTALVPLITGTLKSNWAAPIIGPPERTL